MSSDDHSKPTHTISTVAKAAGQSPLDTPAPEAALKVALQVASQRLPHEPPLKEGHAAYVKANRKAIGGADGDLLKPGSLTDKRGI